MHISCVHTSSRDTGAHFYFNKPGEPKENSKVLCKASWDGCAFMLDMSVSCWRELVTYTGYFAFYPPAMAAAHSLVMTECKSVFSVRVRS